MQNVRSTDRRVSTFYTHFRDKDELLERAIRDMLRANETTSSTRSTGLADRVLRLSLLLFEHIEPYRSSGDAAVDAQGQAIVHEHLQRVLVDLITEELRQAGRCRKEGEHDVPCDLLAQHVASTFLLMLNWWAGCAEPLPATKVNDMFRALVLPALN